MFVRLSLEFKYIPPFIMAISYIEPTKYVLCITEEVRYIIAANRDFNNVTPYRSMIRTTSSKLKPLLSTDSTYTQSTFTDKATEPIGIRLRVGLSCPTVVYCSSSLISIDSSTFK